MRKVTDQWRAAANALLDNLAYLASHEDLELKTDQIIKTESGDQSLDMLVMKEHNRFKIGIQIESGSFNRRKTEDMIKALTEQGIYSMVVLCAQGLSSVWIGRSRGARG